MYQASTAYYGQLNTSKIHSKSLRFTLTTRYWNGSAFVEEVYTLTDDNVVEGSFSIDAQASDSGDLTWGSVYAKSLEATLCQLPAALEYSHIKGASLIVEAGLLVNGAYEYVPMGTYKISSVEWTKEGIDIQGFDAMSAFDIPVDAKAITDAYVSHPYDFATMACTACGVTLGNTRAEFATFLSNQGDTRYFMFQVSDFGDIVTWRDFLFRLAQGVGCFCMIDRQGYLRFIPYSGTPTSTVGTLSLNASSSEVDSCRISDYIAQYSGFYITLTNGERQYYGYDPVEVDKQLYRFGVEYDAAGVAISEAVTTIADLESELSAISEAYAMGRIDKSEYDTQSQAINSQIFNNQLAKSIAETKQTWLNAQMDLYEQYLDNPQYYGLPYFDFEYNPFIATVGALVPSSTETPATNIYEQLRWELARQIIGWQNTPFSYTAIGNYGYDVGDRGYLTVDGLAYVPIYLMAWHYDIYTLTIEGFGADPSLQNTASQSANTAQAGINNLTKQVTALQSDMNSVSGKVSDGKTIIASAITDKGVPTDATASYKQMATNIRRIEGGEPEIGLLPFPREPKRVNMHKLQWYSVGSAIDETTGDAKTVDDYITEHRTSGVTRYYDYDHQSGIYCEYMAALFALIEPILTAVLPSYAKKIRSPYGFTPVNWTTVTPKYNYLTYQVFEHLYLVVASRGIGGNGVDIGWSTSAPPNNDTGMSISPLLGRIEVTLTSHYGYPIPDDPTQYWWAEYECTLHSLAFGKLKGFREIGLYQINNRLFRKNVAALGNNNGLWNSYILEPEGNNPFPIGETLYPSKVPDYGIASSAGAMVVAGAIHPGETETEVDGYTFSNGGMAGITVGAPNYYNLNTGTGTESIGISGGAFSNASLSSEQIVTIGGNEAIYIGSSCFILKGGGS